MTAKEMKNKKTPKVNKVNTNLTIDLKIKRLAIKQAREFGLSLSGYVTFLLAKAIRGDK